MRIVTLLLAAILGWAVPGHAEQTDAAAALAKPKFDFSAQPFDGGNVGKLSWNIQLQRTVPGAAEFHLTKPRGVLLAAGGLTSTVPVLDLPVLGVLKGRYGLAGTITVGMQTRPMSVLIAPSKPDEPCQDAKKNTYANAVIVVIGDVKNPTHLLMGCGEFED